ncbi:DUSAM domain-containing protein [Corallococcus carmarthensis]|uniref:DUSAM domain-containing protein n=1 Tax=Corallococcus carmarthensis TaxID=2316728 RepID=A0A3A8K1B2_9BACT|nr:DUSAM domain-containing protein [Corallococcus carmarthensis]NOK20383.1 DUSAM domain-containing protein [Corallococcus carmarthensis]RKG98244.1 DUSAM domain-containing protein [Corallococcus carmarthensis]
MSEDINWDEVRALAARVDAGEALVLTPDVRELLLRTAREVAIPDAEAQAAIQDITTATALLREERGRIRSGSMRMMAARSEVRKLRQAGDTAGARKVMEDLLAVEVVPLYRELAEMALEDLDD